MSPISLLLPAVSAAVGYTLALAASDVIFGISISRQAFPMDFALVLAVSYTLFLLARRVWVFIFLQWLVLTILYVGNAAKLSFFGGPIVPDDLYAVKALLLILEGWQRVLAAGSLLLLAAALIFNFRFRSRTAWLVVGTLFFLSVTLHSYAGPLVASLDKRFGNSVWNQRENYLRRGASLYTLQETARFFRDAASSPGREEVLGAAGSLLAASSRKSHSGAAVRNVHFILLESFWDPLVLKTIRFDRDPIDRRFRKLWQEAGHSTVMSPVFGGYTANAEFESLCGFPVVSDDVKFERRMVNDAPCLPAILNDQGYDTVASHPNVASFWNRINAYRRIGFQTYWSIDDFRLDDMNKGFLSDVSLYRQVLEKLERRERPERPVLNYIVTYFGHWAGPLYYPRNAARPQVIHCQGVCETPEIESHANAMYYKSRELMDFIEELGRRDPHGLIVAFGDHLPFLGGSFRGYVEAGTLAATRDRFTPEMFRTYVTTPLLIIDGQRGPLDLGTIPLYRLPGEIVRLLGIDDGGILDFAHSMEERGVRPLWGMHFTVDGEGEVLVCRDEENSDECRASGSWLDDFLTVGIDIFQGEQYVLHPAAGVGKRAAGPPQAEGRIAAPHITAPPVSDGRF